MRLTAIKNYFERLAVRGSQVICPCCGHHARMFLPAGVAQKRLNARCAYCGSLERHRLITLMLQRNPLPDNPDVLCIAPEQPLIVVLEQSFGAKLTTTDLERTDVDVQADVCSLPFADASFDCVIANHVLEHVPNDTAAMRELRRIIRPNGRAILQTPVQWRSETTDEDPTAPATERLRRFWQSDHVRLYGKDIIDRLHRAGWNVEIFPVLSHFSPDEIRRYGLEAEEIFLHITGNNQRDRL